MFREDVSKAKICYKEMLFEYDVYNLICRRKVLNSTAWHWHDDFEVCYVISGSVVYRSENKEILLSPGDVLFVNKLIIHSIEPLKPYDRISMSVHFFSEAFLAGKDGTAIGVKYILPIVKNKNIDMLLLNKDMSMNASARNILEENIALRRNKDKFWELDIRENCTKLWKIILDATSELEFESNSNDNSRIRLRNLMTYMQEHYAEKILLEDMAEFFNISIRECNRVFKKCLNITPMNYLYSIRLQHATAMLADEEKNIVDIALENGYRGSSHFSTKFKAHYGMTPMEYRKYIKSENYHTSDINTVFFKSGD